jgi:hypothetical protein
MLKNEEVIFKIVFGMVDGEPFEGFQKNPPFIYQFQLLVIGII